MFDNSMFETWLDKEAQRIIQKVGGQEVLEPTEMMVLVLKAQTNHFAHLDQDLRQQMVNLDQTVHQELSALRHDMDKRFEASQKEMNERFEQVNRRFEQVDKRFEQVDKRFEQVDKRFEQVDKRFDFMTKRLDRFMMWTVGLMITAILSNAGVVVALRYLPAVSQ